MKKAMRITFILGIVLLIFPFIINTYSILRILSIALSVILITVSFTCVENRNVLLILLMPIIIIVVSYGLDTFMFYKFNRIPIFSLETKSSDKVSVYNSFFYRIYNCDSKLILDYGYKENYACGLNDLESLDINTILTDPDDTAKNYKNKYIKARGKISKITGKENIELALFSEGDSKINGYVNFNLNYILRVPTSDNLSKYRIFDNIEVIGLVDKVITEKDKKVILLKDTILIPSDIYNDYTYEIINSESKKLESIIQNQEYYFYGIDSLNIKYDADNIYELNYLLTDNRITWEELIDNSPALELKNDEKEVVAQKYILDKFNLLDCNNGKKIIANKNYELNASVCTK